MRAQRRGERQTFPLSLSPIPPFPPALKTTHETNRRNPSGSDPASLFAVNYNGENGSVFFNLEDPATCWVLPQFFFARRNRE